MLPGEQPAVQQVLPQQPSNEIIFPNIGNVSARENIIKTPQKTALNYFSNCIEILGLQEEVALTNESLKSAYKRLLFSAHPDKGGSEEYFEAITRAYAYLSEILSKIQGAKDDRQGKSANTTLPEIRSERSQEAEKWKHEEPVRLNPKNLDMNAFNSLFTEMKEQFPDPDGDGYGDWLKDTQDESSTNTKTFGGKFNRSVFNRAFEDEIQSRRVKNAGSEIMNVQHPDAMAIVPTFGTEIGSGRPDDYTAPMDKRTQYTDLRNAYTRDSTISDKVSDVHVESRNYDTYSANRKRDPDAFTDRERQQLCNSEAHLLQRESVRQRRKAQEDISNNSYFEHMKQRVITYK